LILLIAAINRKMPKITFKGWLEKILFIMKFLVFKIQCLNYNSCTTYILTYTWALSLFDKIHIFCTI
jgi:hypothetical protein